MVTAPSSNRVILVHDPVNALLELSPALPAALAQADLVLLSGLNAVADPGHARGLAERVVALVRAHLPAGGLVVYEDGGFHEPGLGRVVASTLAPVLDVHSLNEDELQAYADREVDLRDPASVADALDTLPAVLPARTFVVHTDASSRGPCPLRPSAWPPASRPPPVHPPAWCPSTRWTIRRPPRSVSATPSSPGSSPACST